MKSKELVNALIELVSAYGNLTEVLMYREDNISVEAKDEKGNTYRLMFNIIENEED